MQRRPMDWSPPGPRSLRRRRRERQSAAGGVARPGPLRGLGGYLRHQHPRRHGRRSDQAGERARLRAHDPGRARTATQGDHDRQHVLGDRLSQQRTGPACLELLPDLCAALSQQEERHDRPHLGAGPSAPAPADRTGGCLVENNAAGTAEKLGVDYDSLRAIKPDIIMLRAPGYGLSGPIAPPAPWARIWRASPATRCCAATQTATPPRRAPSSPATTCRLAGRLRDHGRAAPSSTHRRRAAHRDGPSRGRHTNGRPGLYAAGVHRCRTGDRRQSLDLRLRAAQSLPLPLARQREDGGDRGSRSRSPRTTSGARCAEKWATPNGLEPPIWMPPRPARPPGRDRPASAPGPVTRTTTTSSIACSVRASLRPPVLERVAVFDDPHVQARELNAPQTLPAGSGPTCSTTRPTSFPPRR